MGTHVARAYFTQETKTLLLSHKQIAKGLGAIMGARGPRMKLKGCNIDSRTEDEVEGLQHCNEDQG